MSQKTREVVLAKLRQRYQSAGVEPKSKLLDQAQELLGYHRKSVAGVIARRTCDEMRANLLQWTRRLRVCQSCVRKGRRATLLER